MDLLILTLLITYLIVVCLCFHLAWNLVTDKKVIFYAFVNVFLLFVLIGCVDLLPKYFYGEPHHVSEIPYYMTIHIMYQLLVVLVTNQKWSVGSLLRAIVLFHTLVYDLQLCLTVVCYPNLGLDSNLMIFFRDSAIQFLLHAHVLLVIIVWAVRHTNFVTFINTLYNKVFGN